MIKFFTYGTFRKGECRHSLLINYGANFLTTTKTSPEYTLLDLGSFPGLIEVGATSVVGELYDIPEAILSTFDMIEGHPFLFCRKNIKLDNGEYVVGYVFQQGNNNMQKIASGDWISR